MSETIPYAEITLTSYAESNFLYFRTVSSEVCSPEIKSTIIAHYEKMKKLNAVVYPTGSKNFYVVPLHQYRDAINMHNLTSPMYAAIWLVSAQLHFEEIVATLPKVSPIVAWSGNNDSIFTYDGINEKLLLAVELSGNDVYMRWMQIHVHVTELNPMYHILMVKKSEIIV